MITNHLRIKFITQSWPCDILVSLIVVSCADCSFCMKAVAITAFVILVWGIAFVNTRALLFDFSALEIQLIRFAVAWLVLKGLESGRHFAKSGVKDEAIFAAMGFCGVALYQFLENSAIYYTNASNVAMLTSFGPVATALMARCTGRRSECAVGLWIGSALAIAGVALISFNNAVVFELRPLGDLMVFGAILAWSVYSMLVEKTKEFPPVLVIRKTFGWALAMMVPLAAWGTTEAGYSALDGAFSVTLDSRRTACASPSR